MAPLSWRKSFSAPAEAGGYEICVQAWDSSLNPSSPLCLTLNTNDNLAPIPGSLDLNPTSVNLGEVFTLTAQIDDSLTGGSSISGAEYAYQGGAWNPMPPADGTFDSPVEQVAAELSAPYTAGEYALVHSYRYPRK